MVTDKKNLFMELVLPLVLLQIILYVLSLTMGINEYENLFIFQVITTTLMLLVCRNINGNFRLIIISAILINIGLLIHCVLENELDGYKGGASSFMVHIGIGVAVFLIVSLILNHRNRVLKFFCTDRACCILAFVGMAFYVVCLVSQRIFGAANWISVGSITIQGTEISKLVFFWVLGIIAEKYNFEEYGGKLVSLYAVNALFLVLCNELGFLIIITLVTGIVLLVRIEDKVKFVDYMRRPLKIICLCLGVMLLLGIIVFVFERLLGGEYIVAMLEKIKGRILGFLFPEEYALSYGYQAMLVTDAMFDAGLFGSGKKLLVPVSNSDMVFSALVFKLGLLFGLVVILLYLTFLTEGFRISYKNKSGLAFTFVVGFAVEILYNLAGVIGVVPIAGVPLPLISSGGTAMVCNMVMLAIIMSVSGQKFVIEGAVRNGKQNESCHDDYDLPDDLFGSNIGCKMWSDTRSFSFRGHIKRSYRRKRDERCNDYWNNI